MALQVKNWTSIREDADSIPGLAQWVKDLAWLWLWLWHRPAAAFPIQPLARELLFAASVALKRKKKKEEEEERKSGLQSRDDEGSAALEL